VERLLREKISLHGICRAVAIGLKWLMHFMVERFAACLDHLQAQLPTGLIDVVMQRLEAEADEMWSFVAQKGNKQWLWIAMNAKTRQIVAFHVGDCSRDSAKQLWANIPAVYREQATFYTDQYDAYKGVIPATQHKAIRRKPANSIIWNASTIPYGSASPVWCVARLPSIRSWPIRVLGSNGTANRLKSLTRRRAHF
jgi:insertion element IS1 protein InsB